MIRGLQELAEPPTWISKPLSAMTPDELRDLLSALHRETPPDTPLLRAVQERLALLTLPSPPAVTAAPSTAPDDTTPRHDEGRAETRYDEDEDEDDSWALEA